MWVIVLKFFLLFSITETRVFNIKQFTLIVTKSVHLNFTTQYLGHNYRSQSWSFDDIILQQTVSEFYACTNEGINESSV